MVISLAAPWRGRTVSIRGGGERAGELNERKLDRDDCTKGYAIMNE